MSTFAEQLAIVRRYLRDPDGNLWSTALLQELWGETQEDLHTRTDILMQVRAMPVPPRWEWSITLDWESEFCDSGTNSIYQWAMQRGGLAYCQPYELQITASLDGTTADYGNGQITHPWEAWYLLPGLPVAMPYPDDTHVVYGLYYDYEPLYREMWGEILSGDLSWSYHQGEPTDWYRRDMVSQAYYLYPRASAYAAPDLEGDGSLQSYEDDTLSSEFGITIFRDSSTVDAEFGLDVDVIDQEDNVLMIYSKRPRPIEGYGDELEWPHWVLKYIRAGVLERAYRVQGDGQIESLAQHWGSRYELGIQAIARYKRLRMEDRKYRLSPSVQGYGEGRNRGPRLPSTYPAI